MFPQTLPRKLVQISEEALTPVQIPLILGHDIFILSYQDIRKIEDCRLFNISKLMPNGVFKSLDIQNSYECMLEMFKKQNFVKDDNFSQLWDIFKYCKELQHYQQYSCATCPQPMEISNESLSNRLVASIDQQLKWDKCVNTSAPFPMTYSCGTSTTDIQLKENTNSNKLNCSCKLTKQLCHKSINTQDTNLDAREQLKQKKLKFSFLN